MCNPKTNPALKNHPGYGSDCNLTMTVIARSGSSHDGYACTWTGGHCNPGDQCATRREEDAKMEAGIEDIRF
ncbi:hypothetical protein RYA05_02250 [Pseudomonas syringae pv. actinidiae]|nr:hypothetical protein [Pseudomonas syringae pv. actinidiae]